MGGHGYAWAGSYICEEHRHVHAKQKYRHTWHEDGWQHRCALELRVGHVPIESEVGRRPRVEDVLGEREAIVPLAARVRESTDLRSDTSRVRHV